jgi:hypothetical protein
MLAATRTVDGNIPVTDATRAQRGTFIVSASALHPDVVELPGAPGPFFCHAWRRTALYIKTEAKRMIPRENSPPEVSSSSDGRLAD